jgi:WD40 repeat protein
MPWRPRRGCRGPWQPKHASSRLYNLRPFPATQLGLLAGGLADGSVCLWDPSVILDSHAKEQHKTPLLAKMQKHTGAVKGLEFNSFSPNLLASGAADADLCIWDLAKPTTPSLYPALKVWQGSGPVGLWPVGLWPWQRTSLLDVPPRTGWSGDTRGRCWRRDYLLGVEQEGAAHSGVM